MIKSSLLFYAKFVSTMFIRFYAYVVLAKLGLFFRSISRVTNRIAEKKSLVAMY